MTKCHAVQHADQMSCEICNLVWDVNDPTKPVCRPGDTVAKLPSEDPPGSDDHVGGLEYRGNSVSFIYQKATAYRLAIDEAWAAMRSAGFPPDGKTKLADAIRAAREPRERKLGAVPMPEPVAYGFGNTAITGHTNRLMMVRLDVPLDDQYAGAYWLPLVLADEARTYGERCRAAGEAAGYARGLAEGIARTGMTPAEHDVLAERKRQISAEGWTPEHDDEHDKRELSRASLCYVQQYVGRFWLVEDYEDGLSRYQSDEAPDEWPWDEDWWKPTAPRRDLVKAAALLLAEIERLDRAALRGEVE